MAQKYDEILDLYVKGIRAASENLAYTESSSGVLNMAREFDGERNIIPFRDRAAIKEAVSNTAQQIIDRGLTVKIDDAVINAENKSTNWTNGKDGRARIKEILKAAKGIDVELGADDHTLVARLTKEGVDHAIKGQNTGRKAAIFNKFIELAGSSLYSYSTEQDRVHSKAGATINEEAQWDSFVAVAEYNEEYYPVVFVVRSIDTDVRSQIYDTWIKKEAEATRDAGTQKESVNGQSSYGVQSTSVNHIISDLPSNINTSAQKNQSRDTDYLSAVERGDMETAQRMVDEAAERAFADSKIRGEDGKLIKVYHGLCKKQK